MCCLYSKEDKNTVTSIHRLCRCVKKKKVCRRFSVPNAQEKPYLSPYVEKNMTISIDKPEKWVII